MKYIKYIGVILYTTFFVGAISALSIAPSSAKYIKSEENVLKYGVKFKDLSSSYTRNEILSSSDAYTLDYGLSFKRKNNMDQSDTSDSYLVNVSNPYCSIDKVYVDGVLTTISDDTITFSSPGEENVDINITCNFQNMVNNNELELSFNTYGYFNNDKNHSYLFAEKKEEIDVNSYYNKYGFPNEDICDTPSKPCRLLKTNDESKMYLKLISWIEKSTKIEESEKNLINTYLKSNNPSFDNKVNEANIILFNQLDGLKASSDSNYYIFEVDDFFGSYAVTYANYNLRQTNTDLVDFYFYTKENIDELFFKYIQKYFSNYDTSIIENYIKTKEQHYSVNNIYELIPVDSRLKTIIIDDVVNKRLRLPSNFFSIISGEKKTYTMNKNNTLKNNVRLFKRYLNSYINPEWTEKILYDNDGKYSYITNCLGKSNAIFDNYTYVTYESDALLIHIYSNNDTEIIFEEQYVINKEINLEYNLSNTNSNIKADLNSISKNIKGTEITLTDSAGTSIDLNDENLLDGEYTSNIGTIKVSTGAVKNIMITFSI